MIVFVLVVVLLDVLCRWGCLSALVSVRRRAGGTTQFVSMVAMVAMVGCGFGCDGS